MCYYIAVRESLLSFDVPSRLRLKGLRKPLVMSSASSTHHCWEDEMQLRSAPSELCWLPSLSSFQKTQWPPQFGIAIHYQLIPHQVLQPWTFLRQRGSRISSSSVLPTNNSDCLQGFQNLGKYVTLSLSWLIFNPQCIPDFAKQPVISVSSHVSTSRSQSPAQSNQLSNDCLNGCCLQLIPTRT